MRVVIRQADLDTCVTAFLLGVRDDDDIVVVDGQASIEDLANPQRVCIEAGSSGTRSVAVTAAASIISCRSSTRLSPDGEALAAGACSACRSTAARCLRTSLCRSSTGVPRHDVEP